MVKPIINLDQIKYRPRPQDFAPKGDLADEFDLRIGRVANHIGAQKLGYNVTAIPPGRSAYPFHSHRINEEMFFVLEGRGAHTAVNGERSAMHEGDFVITPPMAWHDHGNDGDEQVFWLDGLDIPIVQFLDASFAEHHDDEDGA